MISYPALGSPAQDLVPGRPTAWCVTWGRITASLSEIPGKGRHLKLFHPVSLLQKEERTMLEDIWVTLSELDNVTFSFKQLDENYVASE